MDGKNKKGQLIVKACCIVAAFMLWLYIYNFENPMMDKVITVPVSIVNQDALAQSELSPVIENVVEIKINVRGSVSEINDLTIQDFDLQADLATVSVKKGLNDIPVTVEKKPSDIRVTNADNLFITVTVDEMIEKAVPVKVVLEGKTRSGYYALQPESEYKEAIIKGPSKIVSLVDFAVARCDISDYYKNMNVQPKLQAESESGTVYSYLQIEPGEMDLTVQVKKTKTVAVNVKTSGDIAAAGIKSIIPSPDKITIAGDETLLQSISGIDTEIVDIMKLNGAKTIDAKLVVPQGVAFIGNTGEVKLNITYIEKSEKTLDLPVTVKNLSGDMNAALEKANASVTISGLPEAVNSITADKIECYVDLNGLVLEGVQQVKVTLVLPEGISKISVNPESINVILKKNESGGL
jgi:YbbR domain-containing protein